MMDLHGTHSVMCVLCVEGGREHEYHDPLHTLVCSGMSAHQQ